MTTCIYDHINKQVAIDGRVTAGGFIMCDNFEKWQEVDDVCFFFSGALSEFQPLVDAYLSGESAREIDAMAFVVKDGLVYTVRVDSDLVVAVQLIKYTSGIGSGYELAMVAMDFGKSARGAIEYAATRDSSTGGKVSVFNTESMTFEVGDE